MRAVKSEFPTWAFILLGFLTHAFHLLVYIDVVGAFSFASTTACSEPFLLETLIP